MADRYDPREVDRRWRQRWEETGIYVADPASPRPKAYVVSMYPYPSGEIHVGHWYPFAPTDAYVRFLRMRGCEVLFPMGFDAFGLPAENAAIRNNTHPREWTRANIQRMESQLRKMGASFDWSREIVTCDPEYYRWNQWFFLQFLKNDLAYRTHAPVDWCPGCNTTLAREQVIGQERECERCGSQVIKKALDQWLFRTTRYAEELLDFSRLDWPERIISLQRNWIGRSEGASFDFQVEGSTETFQVFTTRPDTIYGVTFCVLAPEHPLVPEITSGGQQDEVEKYIFQATRQSETDRLSTEKERTGVFLGAHALHPLTEERIPIYAADYVLMSYGTGAIMAVPAHDERDFDFARRHAIPIQTVVVPPDWDGEPPGEAYCGEGVLTASGPFDGLPSREAGRAIAAELSARGIGGPSVTYRLRDWLISRQRMWGTPIPVVYCPECGMQPVPDDQLPVLLPDAVEFRPTGESPLRFDEGFLKTDCPACGGPAERETDTMDTFVDSSWYWYRFLSPHAQDRPFDPKDAAPWLPLDLYTGGAEHAVMHLLYARFFHKAMRDLGQFAELQAARPEVNWDEPFPRLFNQGIITSYAYRDADGRFVPYSEVEYSGDSPTRRAGGEPLYESNEKMSKSKLNVVAPDEYVDRYGADVVRLFLMFIGPWEQGGPWNPRGVEGVARFLNRAWTLVAEHAEEAAGPTADAEAVRSLTRARHQAVRKVTGEYERFSFNTVVSTLMEWLNNLQRLRESTRCDPAFDEAVRAFVSMLAPIAPHLAEECWEKLGGAYSVHQQPWPAWDEAEAAEETMEIAVQVNGKMRDRLILPVGADEEEVQRQALASEKVAPALEGKQIRKVVYVPGRILNVVAG